MVPPRTTGSGESPPEAEPLDWKTVVGSVAELLDALGSSRLVTDAVLVRDPDTFELTRTTRVKVALPGARAEAVLVTVPVPPTSGVELLKPAGALNETNVVP